ncbi:MAG: hypothetical protein KIS94_06285 [Chitinophagales bacterium]|nr:hypothetical protein [Chitinophagales bacterium]
MSKEYHFYDKPIIYDSYANRIKRIVTSALLFLIAFILTTLIYHSLLAAIATVLGYEIKFSFTRLEVLPHQIKYWSLPRTILIYVVPSVVMLTLAIIVAILLHKYKNIITLFRMFWLWLSVCLFTTFSTHLITAAIGIASPRTAFYTAFAIPFVWMGFPAALGAVLSIAGVVVSMIWGFVTVNEFLRFAFSGSLLKARTARIYFVTQFYVLPLVVALPFVGLLTLSNVTVYYLSIYFSFLCIALGMFLRFYNASGAVRCNKADVLNVISPLVIIVAAALFITVKFLLK